MSISFSPILITTYIIITVEANIEITVNKNNSHENNLSQSFATINSSVNNSVSRSSNYGLSQIGENIATRLNRIDSGAVKYDDPVSSTDNFEDLKGRISLETLEVIKRLHMQYLNKANLTEHQGFSSFGEHTSRKDEIIHVSGKLEIL